jgi:hypothetical protein
MLSDRVRQRLEQLQRATVTSSAAPPPGHHAAPVAVAVAAPVGPLAARPTPALAEASALPGEEVSTTWGPHWLLRQPIAAVWPASRRYLPAIDSLSDWPADPLGDPPPKRSFADDIAALRHSFPRRSVYLDLETCGFAGSLVFLVGLLHWHQGELVLSQLWARNYAEEKAILQSLWTIVAENDLLITFNGKSFDWPQVQDRSTLHHLGHPPTLWHFDLLHHARRRWRSQLPNCRLQTLERYLCGRHRVGDLPGKDIPQAYHNYVRHGRTDEVHAILHHNALDLVTLLQLALLFLSVDNDQP